MDPEDIFAQLDDDAPPPRMRAVRRTVLGEDPSQDRVEVSDQLVNADAPIESGNLDKGPASGPTTEQIARHEVETGRTTSRGIVEDTPSPYWDMFIGATEGMGATPTPAQARTREHLSRFWDQFTSGDAELGGRNPTTPIVGRDERAAAPIARLYQSLPIHIRDDQQRAEMEGRAARATSQAPELAVAGDAAAIGLYAAAPTPTTAAGRVALGAGTGAAVGGAHSLDAPVQDALVGGAIGGATALGAEGLSRALRGPSAATTRRLGEVRDDALLSATEGAGRGRSAIAAFDRGARDVRASRASAAGALRETDAVPRVGTIRQVGASVDDALGRVEQGLSDIRSAMDGEGPTFESVAARLRARAAEIAREGPESRPLAEMLLSRADDYAAYRARPMDYTALTTGSRRMRQMGMGRTAGGQPMSIPQEALSEVDSLTREAYDDAVEETLGAAERARYQQLRRQWRALHVAQGNARSGEAAAAGNRGFGLTEQLGLYGGGGAGGAWVGQMLGDAEAGGVAGVATMAAARAYRATEPTIRRSAADALYWLAQNHPQALGRFAQPILEAGARGTAALTSTLYVLSQRDAEARRVFEEAQGLDQTQE